MGIGKKISCCFLVLTGLFVGPSVEGAVPDMGYNLEAVDASRNQRPDEPQEPKSYQEKCLAYLLSEVDAEEVPKLPGKNTLTPAEIKDVLYFFRNLKWQLPESYIQQQSKMYRWVYKIVHKASGGWINLVWFSSYQYQWTYPLNCYSKELLKQGCLGEQCFNLYTRRLYSLEKDFYEQHCEKDKVSPWERELIVVVFLGLTGFVMYTLHLGWQAWKDTSQRIKEGTLV